MDNVLNNHDLIDIIIDKMDLTTRVKFGHTNRHFFRLVYANLIKICMTYSDIAKIFLYYVDYYPNTSFIFLKILHNNRPFSFRKRQKLVRNLLTIKNIKIPLAIIDCKIFTREDIHITLTDHEWCYYFTWLSPLTIINNPYNLERYDIRQFYKYCLKNNIEIPNYRDIVSFSFYYSDLEMLRMFFETYPDEIAYFNIGMNTFSIASQDPLRNDNNQLELYRYMIEIGYRIPHSQRSYIILQASCLNLPKLSNWIACNSSRYIGYADY